MSTNGADFRNRYRGWASIPEIEDLTGWYRIGEAPLESACVLLAPLGCAGRRPADDSGRTVRLVREDALGVRVSEVPFTAADRDAVEEHINGELEALGLPSRPRGYAWFLRVPDHMDEAELPLRLQQAWQLATESPAPADVLREQLRLLYDSAGAAAAAE